MIKKSQTSSSQKTAKWLLTYERYALTLVIRKREIKATKRHQHMAMAKAKKESKKKQKQTQYADSDNVGHLQLSCTIDEHLDQHSHRKIVWQYLLK